ncbi:hypothetical protein BsWGS_08590 [Bradybaena similaris]
MTRLHGHVSQVGHVSKIICYPVTSCGGISEDSAHCSFMGLSMLEFRDREYVVAKLIDPTTTQQFHSPMLQEIQVYINGRNLLLKFGDQPDMLLTSTLRRESRQAFTIQCLGMETDALDCGTKVGSWLSECLQEADLRLFNCRFEWAVESKRYKSVACRIVTESSLQEINELFKFDPLQVVENFRPNIVISGTKPLDEQRWDLIYIGKEAGFERRAFNVKLIEEAFDTKNLAWRHESEPHDNLRGAVCIPCCFPTPEFGVYATAFREGKISVGDPVFVVYRSTFLSSYRSW